MTVITKTSQEKIFGGTARVRVSFPSICLWADTFQVCYYVHSLVYIKTTKMYLELTM